jgi:hypothetical protein
MCRRSAMSAFKKETQSYSMLNLRSLQRCPAGGFSVFGAAAESGIACSGAGLNVIVSERLSADIAGAI